MLFGSIALSLDAVFAWQDLSSSQGSQSVIDEPGNYLIFAFVCCFVPIVVFLLSRKTLTLYVLAVLAVLTCGVIQFLYREWLTLVGGLILISVVLVCLIMLFVYQSYKQSVYSANRVKTTNFIGVFGYSAVLAVVAVAIGIAFFYGVVSLSDSTTPEIKLFTSNVSQPTTEYSSEYAFMDSLSDEDSDQTSEDQENQTENEDAGDSSGQSSFDDVIENSVIANALKQALGYDNTGEDRLDEVRYLIISLTKVIFIALVIMLVLAICLGRWHMRKWRIKRIRNMFNSYKVWFVYTFLLSRYKRLKLAKSPSLTPLEYALSYKKAMTPFTRNAGGVDFVQITLLYQDVIYGGSLPSDEQVESVLKYYFAFFKNAK